MVKRTKKSSDKKKPGGLASLANRRQNEDELNIDYPDPWAPPGKLSPPRPPGWKPRVPGPPFRPHRVGGRPLQDPADKREARFALRLHEDLMNEAQRNARLRGWKVTQYFEKILIDAVNAEAGRPVVDAIGRYIQRDKDR